MERSFHSPSILIFLTMFTWDTESTSLADNWEPLRWGTNVFLPGMIWSSGRCRLENTNPTSWPGDERPPRWTPDALSYWEIKECAGSWHSTTELLQLYVKSAI